MSMDQEPPEDRSASKPFVWLERLTAGLLVIVILALAWMIVVAHQATWLRLDEAVEVAVVLVLLVGALVLVSVVALLHTR